MKKYVCDVCGWVYDPEVGDPEGGIAPGTAFEDIPDDWVCTLSTIGLPHSSWLFAAPLKQQAIGGSRKIIRQQGGTLHHRLMLIEGSIDMP